MTKVHVISTIGSLPSKPGAYIIRTEAEENERNAALKALVRKYGKAIEHRLEHNAIHGIWNEIEEMLK